MPILVNSNTPVDDKNFWATSWEAFCDAEVLYGREFEIDVAAEPKTAKCQQYFARPELLDALLDYRTREETARLMRISPNTCVGLDSLNLRWPQHWWCNPPFDLKEEFVLHSRKQQFSGRSGMMLLPYEPLTQWWRRLLARDCIIYEPDGRYQFYERDGKTKKNGANFGSVLVAFPSMHLGESIRYPYKRGLTSPRIILP
ncbi:MAG: DNA N-6-adenine-methyltransferase [Bacteroides thetaiotaomicron]